MSKCDGVSLKHHNEVFEGSSAADVASVFRSSLTPLRLYEKLLKITEKGHQKATEKIAYAMLFGDYINQNVTKAKELFEKLAIDGSPKAQMVGHCLVLMVVDGVCGENSLSLHSALLFQALGFLYAAGLGVNSSQAKVLRTFTSCCRIVVPGVALHSREETNRCGKLMLVFRLWFTTPLVRWGETCWPI